MYTHSFKSVGILLQVQLGRTFQKSASKLRTVESLILPVLITNKEFYKSLILKRQIKYTLYIYTLYRRFRSSMKHSKEFLYVESDVAKMVEFLYENFIFRQEITHSLNLYSFISPYAKGAEFFFFEDFFYFVTSVE